MTTDDVFFLSLGIGLLLLAALDILKTTLSDNGGGFLTNVLARAVWKAFFIAARRDGRSILLSYAGVAILIAIISAWITALWLGLFFILLSDADSVVTSEGAGTGALEKLYYAGFSLSTLGVGDYKANSHVWRLVTSVSAFAGLVFITTSITYFVPILSAVSLQSKLAMYIQCMGRPPQEIVINSWNGRDFSDFEDVSTELQSMLSQHMLHHRAYPVLRYFHSSTASLSFMRNFVQLAEAFYLIQCAIPHTDKDASMRLNMLSAPIDAFLQAMEGDYIEHMQANQGEIPDTRLLRQRGIHLKPLCGFRQDFAAIAGKRRATLTALLILDGWRWADVYPPADQEWPDSERTEER